jgi:hypothetical protein
LIQSPPGMSFFLPKRVQAIRSSSVTRFAHGPTCARQQDTGPTTGRSIFEPRCFPRDSLRLYRLIGGVARKAAMASGATRPCLASPARLAGGPPLLRSANPLTRSHHTWPRRARLAARRWGLSSETPMQRRHLVSFQRARRRRGIRRRVEPLQRVRGIRRSGAATHRRVRLRIRGRQVGRLAAVRRRAVRASTPAARTPARAARASRSSATARPGAGGRVVPVAVRGHYRGSYARSTRSTGISFSIFLAADWGVDDNGGVDRAVARRARPLAARGDRNPPLAIVLRGARRARRRALGFLARQPRRTCSRTRDATARLGGRRRRTCTTTSDDGASGRLRALGVVERRRRLRARVARRRRSSSTTSGRTASTPARRTYLKLGLYKWSWLRAPERSRQRR